MTLPDAPAPLPVESMTRRLLSASLAHELNNIVASLLGFVDLGEELDDLHAIRGVLAEVRISAARTRLLAADLEVLATAAGAGIRKIAVSALLEPSGDGTCATRPEFPAAPQIEWKVEPETRVLADPVHASHALALLARIASEPSRGMMQCREFDPHAAATCAFCQEDPGAGYLSLAQPLLPGRARALLPLHAIARDHLAVTQLRTAVLSQTAHACGWHLVIASNPDELQLVMPRA